MSESVLQENWALFAASILVAAVLIYLFATVYRKSSRGQLRANSRRLTRAINASRNVQLDLERATAQLEKLQAKASRVKPRLIAEAEEALADARALLKIANDQVLIAENHVRRVIHEEFPPARHEFLRQKYLPSEKDDGKPFTF